MMPVMDGHEVLVKLRDMEAQHGVSAFAGAKVIMSTALDGFKTLHPSLSRRVRGLRHQAH